MVNRPVQPVTASQGGRQPAQGAGLSGPPTPNGSAAFHGDAEPLPRVRVGLGAAGEAVELVSASGPAQGAVAGGTPPAAAQAPAATAETTAPAAAPPSSGRNDNGDDDGEDDEPPPPAAFGGRPCFFTVDAHCGCS